MKYDWLLATIEDAMLPCLMHLTTTQELQNLDTLPEQFKDANITELKLLKQVKDGLRNNDQSNIMLRGRRIVIPKALGDRAISFAHEGHQGLVKTK